MKTTTKILSALILCILLISTLASCSQSDVPEGYQLVALEGDCFRLYVPTQWVPNTTSGVTGAFYSSTDDSSVAVYVADDAGELSISEYWAVCNERYAEELEEYTPSEKVENIVLGGQPAEKHIFTAHRTVYSEIEKKNITSVYVFMQVMAKYKGNMYILIYTAKEENYDSHLETVEGDSQDAGIIPYFRFDDAYVSEDGEKEFSDKVTAPDGMKLASTDERAYRLFVPTSWKINNRADASAAYASDTDTSNVNVQMYMSSDESETVEAYWERLKVSYGEMFQSFTMIEDKEIEMDGIKAHKYTYSVVSGGQEFKLVQAIVRKGEMFYCLTFTATPDNFDKHLPDVEKMIESFDIR